MRVKSIRAKVGASLTTGGKISFVGVGPGDPGLLTRRAAELLSLADVVVVDEHAFGEIIDELCQPGVQIIVAPCGLGDPGGGLPEPPIPIASWPLTHHARPGVNVVRLLAGDGLFDKGLRRELSACEEVGVSFEVVPGISLAAIVPMLAGWPQLDGADPTVRVIDLGRPDPDRRMAPDPVSATILRGDAAAVAAAVPNLLACGHSRYATIVVAARAATLRQRSIRTTLAALARDIRGLPNNEELIAVIGADIEFDGSTDWFEGRALFGWNILAPTTQLGVIPRSEQLAAHGAILATVPTILVGPPRTEAQIDRAVHGLVTGRYQWLGFTSTYAVRAIRDRLAVLGLDVRALAGVRVASIPGETAQAVRDWGIEPDLVGAGPGTKGLLEAWPRFHQGHDPLEGVLLPRAEIAVENLVAGLRERGWVVDDAMAYRTMRAAPPSEVIRDAIKHGDFDAVLFTSASCVRNLVGIAGKPHASTVIACIGPATAAAATDLGLCVNVVAPEPTVESIVEALAVHAGERRAADLAAGRAHRKPSECRRARRSLQQPLATMR